MSARLRRWFGAATPPSAPDPTAEAVAALSATLATQQATIDALERRVGLLNGALRATTAQVVEARATAEQALAEANKARQQANSALRTAEAAMDAVDSG